MTVCAVCQSPFEPRRSTARFCGDRCRKRAARGTGAALRSRYSAFVSVTRPTESRRRRKPVSVTLRFSRLDPRIVPNVRYPGMYRLRKPDGTLTDMANLTRIRDALRCLDEAGA
jgi:hypothetical protein